MSQLFTAFIAHHTHSLVTLTVININIFIIHTARHMMFAHNWIFISIRCQFMAVSCSGIALFRQKAHSMSTTRHFSFARIASNSVNYWTNQLRLQLRIDYILCKCTPNRPNVIVTHISEARCKIASFHLSFSIYYYKFMQLRSLSFGKIFVTTACTVSEYISCKPTCFRMHFTHLSRSLSATISSPHCIQLHMLMEMFFIFANHIALTIKCCDSCK